MPVELLLLALGGALGAAIARLLRLPLWPITGAIAGSAAIHLTLALEVELPRWWTIAAQVLVGTAVGSRVNLASLARLRGVLVPALLAVISIVVVGVAIGLAIGSLGLIDPVVATLGSIPGGGGEMVAAATALHSDSAVVAGMHVLRILVVMTTLPPLLHWLMNRGPDAGPATPSDG